MNVRIGDFGGTDPVVQQSDGQRELNAELRGDGIARLAVREARDFPERLDLDRLDLVDSQIVPVLQLQHAIHRRRAPSGTPHTA